MAHLRLEMAGKRLVSNEQVRSEGKIWRLRFFSFSHTD